MKEKLLTTFIAIAGLAASPIVRALDVQCYQGANPSGATVGVSDPTVWAMSFWRPSDEIAMDTIWMNSIAYGPGCSPACFLVAGEQAFAPMSAYPSNDRIQFLNVFVGGSHTLNSEAQGYQNHPIYGRVSETSLYSCTVRGLVAPIRGEGGGH